MRTKFLKCSPCGDIVEVVYESGSTVTCCGQEMEELIPNTSEGASEKHLPVLKIEEDAIHVSVGEVVHPMTEEHSIQWVYLETENGCQRKVLKPTDEPNVTFYLGDEKPIAVYEYCNLHGLWKVEIPRS